MSWSDDTRCLHCDGKLPLYRKLTHGQFCSNAHSKAYWSDQERLAIERLNQTHVSLEAFRLGMTDEPAPALPLAGAEIPDMGGAILWRPAPWPGTLHPYLASDAIAYGIDVRPVNPVLAQHAIEARTFSVAGLIHGWANLSARDWMEQSRGWDLTPTESSTELERPAIAVMLRAQLGSAGRIDCGLIERISARALASGMSSSAEPLGVTIYPATGLKLEISPESDFLVRLLDDRIPPPAHRLALAFLDARDGGPRVFVQPENSLIWIAGSWEAMLRGYNLFPLTPAMPVLPQMGKVSIPAGRALGAYSAAEAIEELDSFEPTVSVVPFATPARHPNLRLASSQLLPLRSRETSAVTHGLTPESFSTVGDGIAIPQRQTPKARQLDGAPRIATKLAALPYRDVMVACGETAGGLATRLLFPQPPDADPLLPRCKMQPLNGKPVAEAVPSETKFDSPMGPSPAVARKIPPIWSHAVDFWQHAPRDLKMLAVAIPVLLALALHPSLPKVALAAPRTDTSGWSTQFKRVINDQWSGMRKSVLKRAAVALNEDFRAGLDDWASPGDAITEWSFDQTGFVKPGPIAIYRPSIGLTDYSMQFTGLIDKKALSWVVRASNFENYYVIKLEVLKPGPIPTMGITRYAVIKGKAQDRVDTPVPISARGDMLYLVQVDVEGDNFSLSVQGQMVDSWSEPRLDRGGVGFFSALGEESRVRWVQVTHQYDMLGRLCAYLAPYNISSTSGSWQP